MKRSNDLNQTELDILAMAKTRLVQAAQQIGDGSEPLNVFVLFNAACHFGKVSQALGFGDWREHLEAYWENNRQ